MRRIPEPQILSPLEEANEYFSMDHDDVNRRFVDDLAVGEIGTRIIDLGCGPGGIAIELCRRFDAATVLAIDAEIEMLEIAKREIDIAGLLDQITLQQADVCAMEDFEDGIADLVISNSLIHHLDEPRLGLESAVRLLRSGGRLFIRDLYRPETPEEVESLVSTYAVGESERAQQLFRQSLFASLTLDEIREIARVAGGEGLGISNEHVQMTSDRHWTIDWTK